MPELQLDFSGFPDIRKELESKRAIAERAANPASVGLISKAYDMKAGLLNKFGCIYFIMPEGQDVCKIGISVNPFKRLSSLQNACWLKLRIKGLFWYPSIDIASSHEYAALQMAKDECVRLEGEWLDLDFMEAMGLVMSSAREEHVFTDSTGFLLDWLPQVEEQRRASISDQWEARLAHVRALNKKYSEKTNSRP